MLLRSHWALWVGCAVALGCAGKPRPNAADGAALAGNVFVDRGHGFSVEKPDGWSPRNNDGAEDVLTLGRGKLKGQIAIAVPKLPPHIPGMIPLMAVENGYVNDVKKRLKNVTRPESRPVKVDGVLGRRFTIAGEAAEGRRVLEVLALAKGDVLYIVTAESPAGEADQVRQAFEDLVGSWKWMERG